MWEFNACEQPQQTNFLSGLNSDFRVSTDNLCADEVKLIKRETTAGVTPYLNNQVNKTQQATVH